NGTLGVSEPFTPGAGAPPYRPTPHRSTGPRRTVASALARGEPVTGRANRQQVGLPVTGQVGGERSRHSHPPAAPWRNASHLLADQSTRGGSANEDAETRGAGAGVRRGPGDPGVQVGAGRRAGGGGRAPFGERYHAGWHQRQAAEQGGDLRVA